MAARTSQGSILKCKVGAGTLTAIPGWKDISWSGGEKTQIDTTTMSDTTPSSIAGTPSPMTATITLDYDPADTQQQILRTAYGTPGQVVDFELAYITATAKKEVFSGEVMNFAPTPGRNAALQAVVQVAITSGPTLTAV